VYRASEADQQAWTLAVRPKTCLRAKHRKLRMIVVSKLILNWSPETISGWLKRRYPSNEDGMKLKFLAQAIVTVGTNTDRVENNFFLKAARTAGSAPG
jgi:IS30 family transposase